MTLKFNIKIKMLVILIGSISLLSSCYYDNEEYLYGPDDCGPNGVSYEEDSVGQIIENNCAVSGCHLSTQTPYFTDFATIQENAIKIREAVESGVMPKNGTLTNEEIIKIQCWVNGGAEKN